MKTIIKKNILFVVTMIVAIAGSRNIAVAQSTATAASDAQIVTPITMSLVNSMNFGNIAVSSVSGGTVVLSSGSTRVGTSGVTLPSSAGTVSAASFTVAGAPSYTYAISLPATAILTNGSHTMTINSFMSTPSGTGTLNSGGTQSLTVGATLSVGAAQSPGTYTNAGAVPVVVNYN
jgi:hypothetical protein